MKNYNEISQSVLSRRDEFEEKQRIRRKKLMRTSGIMGCLVVAVIAAVIGVQSREPGRPGITFQNPPPGYWNTTEAPTTNPTTASQNTNPTTTEIPTIAQPTFYNEGDQSSGGDAGNLWFIPALPFDRSFKVTGEKITDEEAKAYFDEHRESIISSLSASGVPVDNVDVRIAETGYCHVYYDGAEGKSFEIRQNYRDYLVYIGEEEELAAIITLFKENGELYDTPMFGAAWFEGYGDYLKEHKGEKLIYVYASWYEIIIAPDNTYFNPMGVDYNAQGLNITSKYLEGVDKPYEVFYHEAATYTP